MPDPDALRSDVEQRLARVRDALMPQVEGEEYLPEQGAAIVAFNHVHGTDQLLAHLPLGRRISFTAVRERDGQGVRAWLVRRRRQVDADPIVPALAVLERGGLLGIFPEGQRSPDGKLYKGHRLVARLALEAGVPVIPAAVVGDAGMARLVSPRVVFGAPLDLGRFAGALDQDLALQAATDSVMAAIRELSGQQYLDLHTSERRVQLEQQRRRDAEASRARSAAEKAARQAAEAASRAEAAREAADLAEVHAMAARAAQEHARRAAELDERRRAAVRAVRLQPEPGGSRDLREPRTFSPDDAGDGE